MLQVLYDLSAFSCHCAPLRFCFVFLSIQQHFQPQAGKEKKVNIYSLRKLEKGTLEQVDGNTQTDAAFQPGVNSLQEQCRWGEDVYP